MTANGTKAANAGAPAATGSTKGNKKNTQKFQKQQKLKNKKTKSSKVADSTATAAAFRRLSVKTKLRSGQHLRVGAHTLGVVPKRHVLHRSGWDLRARSCAKQLALNLLNAYPESPTSKELKSQLKLPSTTATLMGNGAISFSYVHQPGHENQGLEAVDPASAAKELEVFAPRKITNKKQMIIGIEDELVHDEVETNAVGKNYLHSLLDPCGAPNPGVPDEENRALSMKLRVRTVYLLPMTNDEAYIRITRNPAKHIVIENDAGGVFDGPVVECDSGSNINSDRTWHDLQGHVVDELKSYAAAGQTTKIRLKRFKHIDTDRFYGRTDDSITLDYEAFKDDDGVGYKMVPIAPADSITIAAWTSDTTANNYVVFADFAVSTGGSKTIQTVSSATITGTGTTGQASVVDTLVAPANTVGLTSYGVINQGTGATSTILPKIEVAITLASGPAIYPMGSSDLQDLQVLLDYADDIRTVGCRATLTYVAKKLEGGYVVGGQLPEVGDDVFPEGTLSQLAVIPGMKPRPLNGATPGISFPILPMTKEESDYLPLDQLFDNNDFGEGAIQVVTTGADANLIILQTEMSLQARTERQTLMATNGDVDLKAVAQVQTFLAKKGPLHFVTGNDDHASVTKSAEKDYDGDHPTYNLFPGWFSGNTVEATEGIHN